MGIAFPDGTFLLRGPVQGHQNDIGILRETRLETELPTLFGNWAIGGDGAFPVSTNVLSVKLWLEGHMAVGSREFCACRVAVEWLFAEMTNTFRWLNLKEGQKVALTNPSIIYQCAALLALARTSLYGNKISDYFGLNPPSLSEIFV